MAVVRWGRLEATCTQSGGGACCLSLVVVAATAASADVATLRLGRGMASSL